jgi:hypothetical protein
MSIVDNPSLLPEQDSGSEIVIAAVFSSLNIWVVWLTAVLSESGLLQASICNWRAA